VEIEETFSSTYLLFHQKGYIHQSPSEAQSSAFYSDGRDTAGLRSPPPQETTEQTTPDRVYHGPEGRSMTERLALHHPLA
jgi:hypothetical protein